AKISAVYRSTDHGDHWTVLPNLPKLSPGSQAGVHAAILGDKDSANVVFVAGDRNENDGHAANTWRGEIAANGTVTWTGVELTGSIGTASPADVRPVACDHDG